MRTNRSQHRDRRIFHSLKSRRLLTARSSRRCIRCQSVLSKGRRCLCWRTLPRCGRPPIFASGIGRHFNWREGQALQLTTPALPGTATDGNRLLRRTRGGSANQRGSPGRQRQERYRDCCGPDNLCEWSFRSASRSTVLAVPDTAIVEHDSQAFVFVDEDEGQYQRRGCRRSGSDKKDCGGDRRWAEPRRQDRHAGAFYLKSELLLEGEDE